MFLSEVLISFCYGNYNLIDIIYWKNALNQKFLIYLSQVSISTGYRKSSTTRIFHQVRTNNIFGIIMVQVHF